ncbi:cyclic-di-AMP-binding protein CbpB [Pontibacillus salicampi]|uniref:Cyclic-di-AMP-binding protein CbpB n=1 Tax=Pontibacillus salicampi TaxID=1449801 RepID=A0ABV6LIM7_9BACI
MISVQKEGLEKYSMQEMMIPSEKVAHVQGGNPMEHALLVLVKSGYSAVPVLDAEYKLKGIISKTNIIENMLGVEQFELDCLSEMTVEEVMNTDIPYLKPEATFSDGLHSVIDHPFVCVIDEKGYFEGILTRRAILKRINQHIHTNHES